MMSIFYVVFDIMLHRGTPNFVGFLLVGLVFWNWFSRSVGNGKESIFNARWLILQVQMPKSFFPFVVTCQDFFKQLFVISLLLIFLVFYPTPVTTCWFALPVLIVIQYVLILAVTFLCAALVPFIPDLRFIINTILELLFFASGIFYDLDTMVLPEHQHIIYMNPIAGLLKNYRLILIKGQWPDWHYLFLVFLGSVIFLMGTLFLLKKLDHVYPKVCQQ